VENVAAVLMTWSSLRIARSVVMCSLWVAPREGNDREDDGAGEMRGLSGSEPARPHWPPVKRLRHQEPICLAGLVGCFRKGKV